MKTQDFSTSFLVEQSPAVVFNAINNVQDWWTGKIEGRADELGAEFKYSYGDAHRSTQKVTEFIPDKKITWHVTNSYLSFVEDKDEWNGTDIVFEIKEKAGKTELIFTHKGLVPTYACYGKCSGAWAMLVNDNLRNLIVTGKSQTDTAT